MMPTNQLFLLFVLVQGFMKAAWTNPDDNYALQALKNEWGHALRNWPGLDPCGGRWDRIVCNKSRVVSVTLGSSGLSGQLPGDIEGLSELQTLDLSYNRQLRGPLPPQIGNLAKLTTLNLIGCGFYGKIPDSIGSLKQLRTLSLNSNKFIGSIPPSIGTLLNLYVLDLADNKLSGSIPISNESAPGLDQLVNTRHFHLGKNQLTGDIPPQLFSEKMKMIHLLLDSNQLTGNIPDTLELAQELEVVRLDRNLLSGQVPSNLNNLRKIQELYLSNNHLFGPLPNLTGMDSLSYLDMSNNRFNGSNFSLWFPTLESLRTLVMENTSLRGEVPEALFSLVQLESVKLRNNQLNGNLNIGTSYSNELKLIDLQNNSIDSVPKKIGSYPMQIILVGNPICPEGATENYCILPSSYTPPPPSNCWSTQCSSDQTVSPNCTCAFPYTGTLFFRAASFSELGNSSIYGPLQQDLMRTFQSSHLPVESVSLNNALRNLDDYLTLYLQVFPSGQDYFNQTAISGIAFILSNQIFRPQESNGSYYFIPNSYFTGSQNSSSIGVIIGAAVGGSAVILLLLLAGGYAYCQKRRAETATKQMTPFASWDPTKTSGGAPQLKGVRSFTFEEVKKYTNNFSQDNDIGSGGYGKVYKGTLPNGKLVAIKRAQQGSTQGDLEFKTEIELLSRVHHKNVVSLVGFCFDQSEEMLVYEFVANGTLKNSLSGKSGIRLDWIRRLRIALGAARGIQYLHVLANPPIIHRDIKSSNVLLDDKLNAKVADFGLSKPLGSPDRTRDHSSQGNNGRTWKGYVDPEYYMTNQLTEKSDVYSFGVLLLELITARAPIDKGKYIVREVKLAIDRTKDLYNLHKLVDPFIVSNIMPSSLEKFVDLALRCVEEEGVCRPTMSEVVKEIESIMELAGLNPHGGSPSTSGDYEGAKQGHQHPYGDESLFIYSGSNLQSEVKAN